MNENETHSGDPYLALVCFWIALLLFLATVIYVVARVIDFRQHPGGGDGGFVLLGEYLEVMLLHAPVGIVVSMLVNLFAMFTLRCNRVLFAVQIAALAFLFVFSS